MSNRRKTGPGGLTCRGPEGRPRPYGEEIDVWMYGQCDAECIAVPGRFQTRQAVWAGRGRRLLNPSSGPDAAVPSFKAVEVEYLGTMWALTKQMVGSLKIGRDVAAGSLSGERAVASVSVSARRSD